jgi:hypothetical protein
MYRFPASSPAGARDHQAENVETFFTTVPFIDNGDATGAFERVDSTDDYVKKVEAAIKSVLARRAPGSAKPLRVWLAEQAAFLTANAGPRYTHEAHVSTRIGTVFDWLLGRREAIEALDDAIVNLTGTDAGQRDTS